MWVELKSLWTVFAISVACNTSGHELASSLVEILKSFGIDLTYLWGQGYSGALSLKVPRCTKHQIAINSAGHLCYYASHALNLDNGNTADIQSVWNDIRIMWNVYNVWSTAKMKHCTEWFLEIPQTKVRQNLHILREIGTLHDRDSFSAATILTNFVL